MPDEQCRSPRLRTEDDQGGRSADAADRNSPTSSSSATGWRSTGRWRMRCRVSGVMCSRTSSGTRTRPDIPETDVEIDGIAELWYDDQDALARAAASPGDEAADRRRRAVHRQDQELTSSTRSRSSRSAVLRRNGDEAIAVGIASSAPLLDDGGDYSAAGLSASTASYGKRFTRSMFMPSMRSSRVDPSRRGECSTPVSYRYASPGFIV